MRGIHIIRHLTRDRIAWPDFAERLWMWDVGLGLKTWDGWAKPWLRGEASEKR